MAFLEDLGLGVDIAINGSAALNAWASTSYDLILMDCQMPEMNGFEATRRIRELERDTRPGHTPIVALTANAMEGDRQRCVQAGMDDYMSKPFTEIALHETLLRCLAAQPVAAMRTATTVLAAAEQARDELARPHRAADVYGCDPVQGYYYARPMPTADFEEWVQGRRAELHGQLPARSAPTALAAAVPASREEYR